MSDRPDDVDAAFAEIVADLEREGVGRTIPDLDDLQDDPPDTTEFPAASEKQSVDSGDPGDSPGTSTGVVGSPPGSPGWSLPPTSSPSSDRPRSDPPKSWRGHETDWDWSWGTDDDHYVPPDRKSVV